MDEEEWDDFASFEGGAESQSAQPQQAAVDQVSFDSRITISANAGSNGELDQPLHAIGSLNVSNGADEDEWDDFNGASHSVPTAAAEPHMNANLSPNGIEEAAPQTLSQKSTSPAILAEALGEPVRADSILTSQRNQTNSGFTVTDIFYLTNEASSSHQVTSAAPSSPVLIIQSHNPLDQLDEWDEFESHTPVADTTTTAPGAFSGVVENEEVNEPSPPASPVTAGDADAAAGEAPSAETPADEETTSFTAPVTAASSAAVPDPLADIWDEIESFTPAPSIPPAAAPDTPVAAEALAVEMSVVPVSESVEPLATPAEPAQKEVHDAFIAFDALDLRQPAELLTATPAPVPVPRTEPVTVELPQETAQPLPAVVEPVEGNRQASPEDSPPSATPAVVTESLPSTPVDVQMDVSAEPVSLIVSAVVDTAQPSAEQVVDAPLPAEPADAFSAFDDLLVDVPPAETSQVHVVAVSGAPLVEGVEPSNTQAVLPEESELETSSAEPSPAENNAAVPAASSPMLGASSASAGAFDKLFDALDSGTAVSAEAPAAVESDFDSLPLEQAAHSTVIDTVETVGDASPTSAEYSAPPAPVAVEQVAEALHTPIVPAAATAVGDAFSAFDDLDIPLDVLVPALTASLPTGQPVDHAHPAVEAVPDLSASAVLCEPLAVPESSELAGDECAEFHTAGPMPATVSITALEMELPLAVDSTMGVVADVPVDLAAGVSAGGDNAANAADGDDEWDEFEGHADGPSSPLAVETPSGPLPVLATSNPAEIDVFADIAADVKVPTVVPVAEIPVPAAEEDEWDEFATPTAASANVASPLAGGQQFMLQPETEETVPVEFPAAVREDQPPLESATAAAEEDDDWDDFEGPASAAVAADDASPAPSNFSALTEVPPDSFLADDFAGADAFSLPVEGTAGDVFGAATSTISGGDGGDADAEDDEWDAFEGPATTAVTPTTTIAATVEQAAPAPVSAALFAAFDASPAAAPSASFASEAAAAPGSFAAFQPEPAFEASFDDAAGMTTAGEFGNGFATSGDDEWNAFDSHSGADDFGGFADTSATSSAPAAFEASFDAQFDTAGPSSNADSFAAFGTDSSHAFGAPASFAAFAVAPTKKVAAIATSTPAAEFLSPAALQAMTAPAAQGASDVTFIKTLPHVLLSEEQSKAYSALSSLCGGLFSGASTTAGNTKLLHDLQGTCTLAQPLSATQLDLRGVVSTEAIQSATAATNSTAMRLVPEIEALLSSNAPADALSLQDLALLLESFELKRAMQKKQVAAPVVHHKAPQSSSDKKRLSIDPIAVAKAERGTASEPATSSNSPIDFLFGRRSSGTANSSSGNLAAAAGASSAVSPSLSNSPPRPSGAPSKPSAGNSGGSNCAASANNSSLPPRVATRKSSFMGLTAALSAATATATSVSATTSPGNNTSTASPSTAAAIAVLGSEKSKGEGYYGDSNANLSSAALEFLNALPDLSYILS